MAVDFIRRAVHDVGAAAIGPPAWPSGGKVAVGIGDTAVILLSEHILWAAGIRIAPLPEFLDELVPLFVGSELLEGGPLFIGDDVGPLLNQPLVKRGLLGAFT